MLIVCHAAVVLCFRCLLEEQILAIGAATEVANCSITSDALVGGELELRRFNFVALGLASYQRSAWRTQQSRGAERASKSLHWSCASGYHRPRVHGHGHR